MSKEILITLLNDLIKNKLEYLEKRADNEVNDLTKLQKDMKEIEGKKKK